MRSKDFLAFKKIWPISDLQPKNSHKYLENLSQDSPPPPPLNQPSGTPPLLWGGEFN